MVHYMELMAGGPAPNLKASTVAQMAGGPALNLKAIHNNDNVINHMHNLLFW